MTEADIAGAGDLRYGSVNIAQSFSAGQQNQINDNIGSIRAVRVRKFTASGTYTPDAKMLYCVIECLGGGGAGGGAALSGAGIQNGGGGGGGGGYSRTVSTKAIVGASLTVTIGAGGTPGAVGNNPGGAGGDTSVGTICIAKGGSGGIGAAAGAANGGGGGGGILGTGDFTVVGGNGSQGYPGTSSTIFWPAGGAGGGSVWGYGATSVSTQTSGASGVGLGAGGGGASDFNGGNRAGGAGTIGIAIITEYCTS
jgi:hypothetical protein